MTINPRSKSKHYITGAATLTLAIVAYYNPPIGAILAKHSELVTGGLALLFLAFKERQLFKFRNNK